MLNLLIAPSRSLPCLLCLAALLAALLAGCGGSAGSGGDDEDMRAAPDGAADEGADPGADPDTGPDTAPDTGPDSDTGPRPDTGPDTGPRPDGALDPDGGCVPAAERCNDRDDDCDGEIDEGFALGTACETGVGACARRGLVICDPTRGVTCDVEPGEPAAEQCDGLDDDCDGQVDEDTAGEPCETGLAGVCAPGSTACDGQSICEPTVQAGEERCDRQDNDCDGTVDEGFDLARDIAHCGRCGDICPAPLHTIATCEDGRCGFACEAGYVDLDGVDGCEYACRLNGEGEICNGIDDDCNGLIDDRLVAAPCATGLPGVCAVGLTACMAGAEDCRPTLAPLPEICNVNDDDCDGLTDEGVCAPLIERCDNAADDDGDGAADCADPDCAGFPACPPPPDCADLRVAVIGGPFYHDDLRTFLDALPDVTAERIDACDPATLAGYDVVVVHGNLPCPDQAIPDTLAAFVQAGGGLIGLPWVINNGIGIGILPVSEPSLGSAFNGPAALAVAAPQDPLAAGLDFTGQDGACAGDAPPRSDDPDCAGHELPESARPGATVALTRRDDPARPAAAWWRQGAGVAVYLGVHYVTADTYSAIFHPWGQRLMQNAVSVAAGCHLRCDCADPACAAEPACALHPVGQFNVNDGPQWNAAGVVSTACVTTCATLFGGDAAAYGCSTDPDAYNGRAFASGWGDGQHCAGEGVAEDFVMPADGGLYNCGMVGCSYSAYVADHCGADVINHCWRRGR